MLQPFYFCGRKEVPFMVIAKTLVDAMLIIGFDSGICTQLDETKFCDLIASNEMESVMIFR